MRYRATLSRTLSIDPEGRLRRVHGWVFGMAFVRRTFLTGLTVGVPDMVGFKTCAL